MLLLLLHLLLGLLLLLHLLLHLLLLLLLLLHLLLHLLLLLLLLLPLLLLTFCPQSAAAARAWLHRGRAAIASCTKRTVEQAPKPRHGAIDSAAWYRYVSVVS